MKYESKSEKETASTTGPVDPRDIITNEDLDQEDDDEDLAWAILAAYSWVSDEDDD